MSGVAAVKVPFMDLPRQYRAIQAEVDAAIQGVLGRAAYVMGPELEEFEAGFARYLGVDHCVGVSSGSDALVLALAAAGVGPGDEVLTVPSTFIATTEAITRVGAAIRFVDIDPRTYTMDVSQVEARLTPRTRALLPVHLYGHPADLESLLPIARRQGLRLIEDCAQAHGAVCQGRRVGSQGDAACFSFYPSKNLGAFGDGGAVVTSDAAIADRVRLLRDHGQVDKYVHAVEGFCHRLDNLQAAVLGVKLRHLDEWNAQRRRVARAYDLLLEPTGVVRPFVSQEVEHAFHLYVIQASDRDDMRARLLEDGIATGLHYPVPLHCQPAYAHLGLAPDEFPVASSLAARCVSLPIFPELDQPQVEVVAAAVHRAAEGHAARVP